MVEKEERECVGRGEREGLKKKGCEGMQGDDKKG